ncbi:sulfotransferase family protein [Glycomyces xiaoerkulensis]|uniref:sulfotransferase family protein n=1 Tax=Glycomyces xiaoerkulensis TaxID=2038139 RepID=UPI000C25D270|nr:sulfotransferase family protein [Glycomyces xiaoerkulensis]
MLQVIGAGLPRTGTMTIKAALETLLGEPCHHMAEVFGRKDIDVPAFSAAVHGDFPDWDELFAGYAAAVDWPASAFYPELAERYPDAVVVLSVRDSFETWWTSTSNTVLQHFGGQSGAYPGEDAWEAMVRGVWSRAFDGAPLDDVQAIEAAYHRYHERVRETVPAERLVEFRTGAGWEPLCSALGLPVPDEPFPHLNSTADFHAQVEDIKEGR